MTGRVVWVAPPFYKGFSPEFGKARPLYSYYSDVWLEWKLITDIYRGKLGGFLSDDLDKMWQS